MEGEVDLAIHMAAAAKDAGAWGFKVQLLTPELIAAAGAPKYWSDQLPSRDQREAFTLAGLVDYGAWREVKEACDSIGIVFFATPFDLAAVDALYDMGVQHFKIASGDLTYRALIESCHATGGEVILSTGAAYKIEIIRALRWAPQATLLACTLSYPTPIAAAHLARIESLRRGWPGKRVGYSDHTSHNGTALAAAALGAELLEVHYTHDRRSGDVPDHAMAVDPDGLADYVAHATLGALLRGSRDLSPCSFEDRARKGARRSAHAARDLKPGEVLTAADVVWVRPDGPIEPHIDIEGLTVVEPVRAGEMIRILR
jgi:sialic acid synthase SpsE